MPIRVTRSSRDLLPGELETFVSVHDDPRPPRAGDMLIFSLGLGGRAYYNPVLTVAVPDDPLTNPLISWEAILLDTCWDWRIKRRRALCPKRRYTA